MIQQERRLIYSISLDELKKKLNLKGKIRLAHVDFRDDEPEELVGLYIEIVQD